MSLADELAERRAKQIGDREGDPNWWRFLDQAKEELRTERKGPADGFVVDMRVPAEAPADASGLVERLLAKRPGYVGSLGADGRVAYEEAPEEVLVNPDGPEAVDALAARDAELNRYKLLLAQEQSANVDAIAKLCVEQSAFADGKAAEIAEQERLHGITSCALKVSEDARHEALAEIAALKKVVGEAGEVVNDGIATMAAVRATASGDEWAESAKHFHDLCGETMLRARTFLTSNAETSDGE